MQARTRLLAALPVALSLACSGCAHARLPVTVCQPQREAEVPVFECTPPIAEDYTLGFDQAKDLVCIPVDDYGRLRLKDPQ